PYLYTDGIGMVDLGTLPGGTGGQANGINALGLLVGFGDTSAGAQHAFLYRNGTMTDLNTLISPSSGWVLSIAVDINDLGSIVGVGTHNGQTASFLLTPVPEPSTLALVALGMGAIYIRRRDSGAVGSGATFFFTIIH